MWAIQNTFLSYLTVISVFRCLAKHLDSWHWCWCTFYLIVKIFVYHYFILFIFYEYKRCSGGHVIFSPDVPKTVRPPLVCSIIASIQTWPSFFMHLFRSESPFLACRWRTTSTKQRTLTRLSMKKSAVNFPVWTACSEPNLLHDCAERGEIRRKKSVKCAWNRVIPTRARDLWTFKMGLFVCLFLTAF